MKNIFKILTLFIGLATISSCDNTDLNLDPTRPGGDNVSVRAIVPAMQTQTHRNMMANGARLAGIIMQQWAGFDAQQVAFTQYNIGEGDIANLWEFGLYVGSMKDCDDIITRTTASGNLHTRGLARLYYAYNLGMATNLWGDIPFSEAFKGADNLTPAYDSQEDVYTAIISLLDGAIADLNSADPAGIFGNLTSGPSSASDWAAVAHALKARYLLQQSKVNPGIMASVISEVNQSFTSNDGQPEFVFENTSGGRNPISAFGAERPNTMVIGPSFATLMTGDPRQEKYMFQDGTDFLFYDASNADLFWAQQDSPSLLISYAEVKFIEAEALLSTGGNALMALQAAVTANMEYLGVPAGDITTYVNALTLTGTAQQQLETIITEKYKAFYGHNAIEAWNDYRRTGFPTLTADANGANGNNPSGIVPLRFLYPDSERLANSANYNAAISNQGGHLLDDPLWVWR